MPVRACCASSVPVGGWHLPKAVHQYNLEIPTDVEALMPEPKTDAARRAREEFRQNYASQLERSREFSLSILVWGPSPTSDSLAARKRVEIGHFLADEGHNAMFSEQLAEVGATGTASAKAREYVQAKLVHLIFILIEGSPGALAEAIDFICFPHLAHKCVVLAPNEYKAGYAASGPLKEHEDGYRGVFWYSAADLVECNVLGEVRVRSRARRLQLQRIKEALDA